MITSFVNGFTVGASLIVAIGAQNTFVLSQGIKREHIIIIPAISAFCDILLIMIGVAGTGTLVSASPKLQLIMAWLGAAFLTFYGLMAMFAAIKGKMHGKVKADGVEIGLKAVILTLLGLTFLNPHVYLDTIVLIGSISGQEGETGKYIFGLGASFASLLWFFSLSIFGVIIAPLFKNKRTWQVLNVIVAITMFLIAWKLVKN